MEGMAMVSQVRGTAAMALPTRAMAHMGTSMEGMASQVRTTARMAPVRWGALGSSVEPHMPPLESGQLLTGRAGAVSLHACKKGSTSGPAMRDSHG